MPLRCMERIIPMSLLVTCPNCGPREVFELRCAGESATRPLEPPTQRELNDYLYVRDNEWGFHREWWFCRVCEEWFVAERHTRTNEVKRTWHTGTASPELREERT
jgi:sarcosine oxidase, subunit delta